MKKLCLVLWFLGFNRSYSQTLTEINFTYPTPKGHLTGQFHSVTHSSDGLMIFAASHAGGIFRSRDRGATFTHLKNFPSTGVVCIRYIERSTPVLIVTVEDLWLAGTNWALAWYSTDNGDTWTKSRVAARPREYRSPVRSGYTARGYDLDYNPVSDIIYMVTDLGLLQSTDGGVSFTYRESPAAMHADYKGNPTMVTVKWIKEDKICMAGSSGFYYSADGGLTWEKRTMPVTATESSPRGKKTIGFVPSTDIIIIETNNFPLEYYSWSPDYGTTWNTFSGPPAGGDGCGGFPYLKCRRKRTAGAADSCIMYASNKCNFFRKGFKIHADNRVDFSNTAPWDMIWDIHSDSHEITFLNEPAGDDRPYLLSTDGGLHKSTGIFDFPLVSGPHRGLNALLIYDMTGQMIRNAGGTYNHILYYGTQDNNLGYWEDQLPPLENHPDVTAEGRGLEADPYGGNITYTAGSPYYIYQAGNRYSSSHPFSNCPNNIWWPFFIKPDCYVQLGTIDAATGTIGLYITNNNGRDWRLLYSKAGESPRIPKVGRVAENTAFIYMPIQNELGNQVFVKIIADLTTLTATTFMPRFGGFLRLGYQQWEIPVFAVNPANPEHIVAPDVGTNTLKQSVDGGNNWTEIPGLSSRIINSGLYKFSNIGGGCFITSVGFSPNGEIIVVGTVLNGIFYSLNRGSSWEQLEGSSGTLKNIYQPYFKQSGIGDTHYDIYFPTHGRGIWKVQLPRTSLIFRPDILYWKHLLKIPRDFGVVRNITEVRPYKSNAARFDDCLYFSPGALKAVNNTTNGISVLLDANTTLYSRQNGFIIPGYTDLPALSFQKVNEKTPPDGFDNQAAEKIVGVAVSGKKIVVLLTAGEEPPFFASTKKWITTTAASTPPYDASKLNAFQNKFLVSDGKQVLPSFPAGKKLQLVCGNLNTGNGAVKEWDIFLDNKPWTSFTANMQQKYFSVPLPAEKLPIGNYEIEVRQKGKQEPAGRVFFEVMAYDKK